MIAVSRGLLIGAAGGALFWLAGMPAPWLAGSMIAAVVAVFAGAAIAMPDWLRAAAFIFLGIQTGTSVTWATVERAAQWPLSIGFLGLTVIAVTWAGMQFYMRVGKRDAATALFASLPGALSLVLLLADEAKADMRRVAISQCIRLFFLIAALPALIAWLSPGAGTAPQQTIGDFSGIVLLVVLASVAGFLFERLKVPAGLLLGPTLTAAALELSGFVQGTAPAGILIPANVVLGVMIAARFAGFRLAEFREALGEGFIGFLLALAIAAAGAGLASLAAGLPFALTLLAFSPGGLDAMIVMAFALDLDPAYVGAHQIARYVGLSLLMPLVAGFILRRAAPRRPLVRTDED
ncbi:MAG: AbrB family transcriptional regulator [Hyphomicrobiales bacterium]